MLERLGTRSIRRKNPMKIVTAIFIVFLAAIVIGANQELLPDFLRSVYSFPGGDKAGHFLLMGTLSLLVNLSFGLRQVEFFSRRVLLGTLVVLVVVILEEASQLWFSARTFSLVDLGFDYMGIIGGGYLALSLKGLGIARQEQRQNKE